jgi:hypothetical protein
MTMTPEGQYMSAEIPQNWSECGQPISSQNHIIAAEGKDEEVNCKLLGADDEIGAAEDPRCRHSIPVGDSDGDIHLWYEAEAAAGRHPRGDEVVRRPRIQESSDVDGVEANPHLHGVAGADASNGN